MTANGQTDFMILNSFDKHEVRWHSDPWWREESIAHLCFRLWFYGCCLNTRMISCFNCHHPLCACVCVCVYSFMYTFFWLIFIIILFLVIIFLFVLFCFSATGNSAVYMLFSVKWLYSGLVCTFDGGQIGRWADLKSLLFIWLVFGF